MGRSGLENQPVPAFFFESRGAAFLTGFALSGAFFPISSLPPWMAAVTMLDPLTYGLEGIRYGLTGSSQINPVVCLAVLGGFTLAMTLTGAYLFRKIKL